MNWSLFWTCVAAVSFSYTLLCIWTMIFATKVPVGSGDGSKYVVFVDGRSVTYHDGRQFVVIQSDRQSQRTQEPDCITVE